MILLQTVNFLLEWEEACNFKLELSVYVLLKVAVRISFSNIYKCLLSVSNSLINVFSYVSFILYERW